jgi:hypothetical protein
VFAFEKKKKFDSLAEALGPICEFIRAFCSLFRPILFVVCDNYRGDKKKTSVTFKLKNLIETVAFRPLGEL